jgi:hypothetical protein
MIVSLRMMDTGICRRNIAGALLGRQKQEGYKFKVNLGYMLSSRPVWVNK